MIESLIKESLIKGKEIPNYYMFAALIIIDNSELDKVEDWIRMIILNI